MEAPISWVREYTPVACSIKEFEDVMTMSGSKVETTRVLGGSVSGVVAGKILSIEKHPDADKLVVTKVDAGSETLQIVTGAANLKVGDFVPVATDGATLADGTKIKRGKLRGVESNGMLCSIEELGYSRSEYPEAPENGIYVFTEPQEPGVSVVSLLELYDEVAEFEITSNRTDCNSIVGIAREAAAAFGAPFTPPDASVKEAAGGSASEYISIDIQNPDCLRYCARVIKNVKIEPSPLWLRHRLIACGVRPINNIVDVTNYVMLELGQPMHAFDADGIAGGRVVVRRARDGEKFITLDGNERALDSSMMVIADPEKAVAIAGVMGGENSKVTAGASAILLESACFAGANIRQTSKKLGLRTDASSKYEKGLDPNLCDYAVNRAAHLIELLGAGEAAAGISDNYPEPKPPVTLPIEYDKINALIGFSLSRDEIDALLTRAFIEARGGVAHIPTFRADIELQADLAEEAARLYGYDKIESSASPAATAGRLSRRQKITELIKDTLAAQGYFECVTYSFESPKAFDRLLFPENAPERRAVKIQNPLGSDYSVMRTTPLNGMAESLSLNCARRNKECRLFNAARTYAPRDGGLPEEKFAVTLGAYGEKFDFFDMKGAVCALLDVLGIKAEFLAVSDLPYAHPGRAAKITKDGVTLGFIGELHPTAAANYEIGRRAYISALDGDALIESADLSRRHAPLPKFPAITRDIALLAREEVPVAEIERAIFERGGKILESAELFDVYSGNQIGQGCKSVAYNLTLRSSERTLTEDEAAAAIAKILKNIEEKTGAKLRE
ncbi:MAG: phenylalanine--tRNA ligase subunit beta [Clostridiales bacterium]|jgi:phenylalanyl-tRNA synthetase beta chain|nr:phenylalanine--tRNA ligase subunit beta [Clostridiales bacterium]